MRLLLIAAAIMTVGVAILIINHAFIRQGYNRIVAMPPSTLALKIPAFADGASIPSKFTCDGQKTLSPALEILGVPEGTLSLALIMDDPDVPKQLRPDGLFVHWVLFNMPATTTGIAEGSTAGVVGANGAGANSYTGPCPPPQYEPSEHRYMFKLYALDQMLPLSAGATKEQVEKAMDGHILAQTQYVGKYKRQ